MGGSILLGSSNCISFFKQIWSYGKDENKHDCGKTKNLRDRRLFGGIPAPREETEKMHGAY